MLIFRSILGITLAVPEARYYSVGDKEVGGEIKPSAPAFKLTGAFGKKHKAIKIPADRNIATLIRMPITH